jgi:PelA/Pel-15E family pectate lyase
MLRLILIVLISISTVTAAETLPIDAVASAADRAAGYFLRTLSVHDGYTDDYDIASLPDIGDKIRFEDYGTPLIGLAYLRLYKATGASRHLEAAKAVANALIRWQLACGGWNKKLNVDITDIDLRLEELVGRGITAPGIPASLDDNNTQGVIAFLIQLDETLGFTEPVHSAALAGLDFMLTSQYENGAWPMMHPQLNTFSYTNFYTFNDACINDCIELMLEAYDIYSDERYLQAALKSGDFIIESQLDSAQAGWAEQYDNKDGKPAWARPFEPPSVCSRVAGPNISTLVDLYLRTGDEKYLAPIPSAIAWLDSSALTLATIDSAGLSGTSATPGQHARYYELGTNRPIFGDYVPHPYVIYFYKYTDISEERQDGYSWYGSYSTSGVGYYERVMATGREAWNAAQAAELTPEQKEAALVSRASSTQSLINALDDESRWVSSGLIYTSTFYSNLSKLASYVELADYATDTTGVPVINTLEVSPAWTSTLTDTFTFTAQISSSVPLSEAVLNIAPLSYMSQNVPDGENAWITLEHQGAGVYTGRFGRELYPSFLKWLQPIAGTSHLTLFAQTTAGKWSVRTFPVRQADPVSVTGETRKRPVDLSIVNNPNPFNPSTSITYTIPEMAQTEIVVFDVMGQRIVTLYTGMIAAGIHTVVWDGHDASDHRVASGVYLCRVRSGDKTAVRRMVLAR